MKQDLIFFCCLFRVRDNFKIMRMMKEIMQARTKIPFCLFDALLIYYYLILGLQSDTCLNYIEYYVKKIYHPHSLITHDAHHVV